MKYRGMRGLAWLLAVLLAWGAAAVPAFGAQYDIQKNRYLDVKKTPAGKTGQIMSINMVFTNPKGSGDLKGVSIRFDNDAVDSEYDAATSGDSDTKYNGSVFPFEVTSNTFDVKMIGTVKGSPDRDSTREVSLSARVRRDIGEGYYSIPIVVKINGNDFCTDHINIWITKSAATTESGADDAAIRFELGENQPTPQGAYPNVMDFNVNVRNSSKITAFDVNVRMEVSEDAAKFPYNINDGNYVRHYDRLGGGEEITVPYSMAIRKDSYTGYYPIKFTVEFRDSAEGDIQKQESVFYVYVISKDKESETREFNANDRTKARLIIDGFETDPKVVYAGEEFQLILRMKNASDHVAASNILFTLDSEKVTDSAVFTSDAGSTSVTVSNLSPGQTTDLKVRLRAGAWVDQRAYAVTVNETYDSPEFKNASEKVSVNIPVKQHARLNTGTIDVMPDAVAVGEESNVMFQVNNMGKVILYNVMVTFTGSSIQKSDVYVGNIKPGESGSVDTMITGASPTEDDGKIKIAITYEDENGVPSQPIEKELTLTVTEQDSQAGMSDGGMVGIPIDAKPEQSGGIGKLWILPVILAAAAGITAIVLVRRRKKKKADEKEETDHEI